MAPEITVILNASARQADEDRAQRQLAEIFSSKGMKANIWLGRSGGDIVELARRSAKSESAVIVAGGGDGTINAIASKLVDTGKVLGVLPLGTLNHFAKDLNIPLDLEAAVDVLNQRNTVAVDIGEVNGFYFLNNSGLGLYPRIVEEREEQQAKGRGKWLAFLSALLIIIHRYPLLTVRLDADGRELLRRTPMVFIGNNEYELQGRQMGSRKCVDAGMLFLYVTRQMTRWGLFRMGLQALFGKLYEAKDFDAMCVKELWVQAPRRRLKVALDGEITALKPPLRYRIHPAALRVIVPANKRQSGR